MYRLLLIILLIRSAGLVDAQSRQSLADTLTLNSITGKQIKFCTGKQLQVIIFLSIDCPLSQKYTRTLNELSKKFASKASFYGVFPDTMNSLNSYRRFQEKYVIPFELMIDQERTLTKSLNAQVTPECFVLSQGKVIYHGAIDDWIVELGKTKSEPKIHYLENAITSVLSNRTPVLDYIKPVGCFID